MRKRPQMLSEIFLNKLQNREPDGGGYDNYEMYSIFYSLFIILSPETLEIVLENAYRDRRKSGWYTGFHKQIRQTDFFNNCYRLDADPKLNAAEQKEWEQLNKELNKAHDVMHIYEQELRKSVPDESDPTYIQKQAEHDVAYKKKYRELFPQEKHSRRFDLRSKLNEKKQFRISGYLDSVLWTVIHLDKNDVLYKTLKETFNAFLLEKQLAKRKKKITK